MLTIEDLQVLRAPFAPEEHEILRGFVYIREDAVTTRLEEVDANWEITITERGFRDNQAFVVARMTVKSVSRENVGMQPLTTTNKETGEVKENGEPEKGAATDALKRCARLFGVGRYLLSVPDNVRTMQALTAWLRPSSSWTKADVLEFRKHWHARKLTDEQLFEALGLFSMWSEWTGSVDDANARVNEYIARPARAGRGSGAARLLGAVVALLPQRSRSH